MKKKNKKFIFVEEITYRCNNNCKFCYIDPQKRDLMLDVNQIKEDLKNARSRSIHRVVFTGGEPTIHPNLIEIVAYAKNCGFDKIHIISNGRRFADDNFARRIIKAGANIIVFSLHGHNAEVHDSITRGKGSFNQLCEGIDNVKK